MKPDGICGFMKKFVNGHRIVSTGDLTLFQIAEAKKENRFFVDSETGLGWVALPWELTTAKDKQRESDLSNRK